MKSYFRGGCKMPDRKIIIRCEEYHDEGSSYLIVENEKEDYTFVLTGKEAISSFHRIEELLDKIDSDRA